MCADPPACDPTTVVSRLSGLSAFRFADNEDIELEFFGVGELDIKGTTCLDECQDNDECFAFDETSDGEYATGSSSSALLFNTLPRPRPPGTGTVAPSGQ